ncbi:MIP/aquaporin family protein [Glycomyces tritici]|uniref:Aquaporin n=1 Tax=Glycomyces tritici TaxID=2665176 RepID=A0ABT7YR72_9ACTN|nr:aquaporin [Glycomyces tritici]MDN3241149.1 aquaporin [Glycomyces tritici]
MREFWAELLGTFILVFFAVGSAVYGIETIGFVGVALAFGLVLLALAYAVGPITGCHVNPAVTLGALLAKRVDAATAGKYWSAQFIGGIAGAAMLKFMTTAGDVTDQTGVLGANDYGATVNLGGAIVIEILMTFLLVFTVLAVTSKRGQTPLAGAAIGLVLAMVHLVGIPLTGTSVNPARSLGPALFAGGEPLAHVWVFILAPLVGGILGAVVQTLMYAHQSEGEAVEAQLPASSED